MKENRPSAEQLATFRKNANDMSLSAEVRAKFQSVVDKFADIGDDVEKDVKKVETEITKPKERKPRTTKSTTEQKKERKPRATKQTGDDVEKAKAEIKKRTGKTEEECEKIIEEYRSLRTKSQERKKKEEQANVDNKKRVEKLEKKGDIIAGTNEKTADAVIETTKVEVSEKIEKEIEKAENIAEKEAKKEVEKEMPKATANEKKKEVAEKVKDKVKEKTKVVVKRVVVDTSALLSSIAESLGKFDKDSQKEFLIKLRSDIDKLLAKYSYGGMTDGAVQTMNITQSNLSSSSVNMFARGGSITKEDALKEAMEMGVDFEKDFHSQSYGNELSELAKKVGYRKSPSSSGSLGRAFFYHLQKIYDKKNYAKGGGVGEWKIGDKFRVLKGIYGDYNSPRYANKEFEVINIRDGKYIDARTPKGTTETFDMKNIEKIKYAGGGGVRKVNGREYPFGSAWALEHNKHNKSQNYEVPMSSRKGKKYANGGIVQEDAQSINTIALLNGVRKSENTFQEFKRKLTQIIKRNGYRMPTEKAFEIAYETNQFAKGGGVRKVNGREYPFGSAWALEHNKHNKSQNYEVPMSSRKGKKMMAKGGETMSMYNAMQRRRGM